MSSHYLLVARMGEKFQFFSLTSNANPKTLEHAARRLLKARCRKQPTEFFLTPDFRARMSRLEDDKEPVSKLQVTAHAEIEVSH